MENSNNGMEICSRICDLTDELRDWWLQCQSRSQIKELMTLTVSQSRLLRAVWRLTRNSRQGIMLRDLAQQLGLSSSAVSVMVENLVQRGYLDRENASDDRRKVWIRISRKGQDYQKATAEFFRLKLEEFFQECDPEKLDCFEEILNKFNLYLINAKGREE